MELSNVRRACRKDSVESLSLTKPFCNALLRSRTLRTTDAPVSHGNPPTQPLAERNEVMAKYTKEQHELAANKGLHLVTIDINGTHAKRGSMTFAGPTGPKTVEKLYAFFTKEIAPAKKRLQ